MLQGLRLIEEANDKGVMLTVMVQEGMGIPGRTEKWRKNECRKHNKLTYTQDKGSQWSKQPGVGLVVRVAAWDPRVLSSSPVGR